MTTSRHHQPPMVYISCDVPAGLTLSDWRASRRPASRARFARVRALI